MRKILSILVILLLSAVAIQSAEVTNISVSYQPGLTVARIDLSGQVRYTHLTEIPKEGRGHRVIVDLLAANHELGQKEFLTLPDCFIQSVRTSQFAVTPEQIVRIVFDVGQAPLYRIESDKNSVTLFFTNKNQQRFASWNTKSVVAKRKASTKTKLVTKSAKSSTKTKTVAAVPKKARAVKSVSKATPKLIDANSADNEADQFAMNKWVKKQSQKPLATSVTPAQKNKTVSTKATTKATPKMAAKSAVKKTTPKATPKLAVKQTSSKPKAKTKPVVVAKSSPSPSKPLAMANKSKPVPAMAKNSSTERRPVVVVKNQNKTQAAKMPLKSEMKVAQTQSAKKVTTSKKTKSASPKLATTGQNALAGKISGSQAKVAKKPAKKTRTSRFRRKAGQGKITGTMVAEFPRRLVIKYKGGAYRDPFETLINSTRNSNSPIEKVVPNIEGLRLVGVVESDSKVDRALFEDIDGFGYILRSGDKVRNGYVLRVESDRVYFQIFEYGWSRTVALQLQN